ncbi:unnamed protein product [Adineta steineri]|uniref:NAD(P)(+)--arginine ADP-ribosyltransferase n=3 Tax=Adineta steineri TaxID=433720 RepID=A0A815MZ69_9BILA|nr:unnamed protein product [Adineta steineri]
MATTTFTTFRMCPENTSCDFYLEVKNDQYTTANRIHMDEYRHEKTACEYGQYCDAFIRLCKNGYEMHDIGHCTIYLHVGRRGGLSVEENMKSKKFISGFERWEPGKRSECRVSTNTGKDGDLVNELNKNGFSYVLHPIGGPYKCLSDVVRDKLKHPRHVRMGSPLNYDQMLAVILYTDTAIYADLRLDEILFCQQNPFEPGDNWHQQKWPIFGAILDSAIRLLYKYDERQNRPPLVYHGLRDTEIDKDVFNNHGSQKRDNYFKYGTFVSTSWDKEVSLGFMCEKGCLLEIDTSEPPDGCQRLVGADVSWISKFPVECEFLIARKPTFEIMEIGFDIERNCQLVRVQNGNNLYSNSD